MKHAIFLPPLLALPAFAQEPTPTPTPNAPEDRETVIVVTAERNAQPLSQTPSAVTVITRQQIEAKKPFEIAELIRLVPGVSVAQSGTRGKSTSIFTRGTNSNHTLVLLDGVRANNPSDGRFDFGQIPAENIERIEVVRGPGSALYGSDALGGVINIITRRGEGPFRSGGQLEFGNQGLNRQVLSGGGELGRTRVAFSLFRRDTDGQFRNDDFRDTGASLRLDQPVLKSGNLAFIARRSSAKFGVPGQRDLAFDPFQRDNSRDTNYSLQFTNTAGKRRDRISYGIYDRKLTDDDTRQATNPAPLESRFNNRVRTIEAQTSYQLGINNLTAGFEERRESANVFSSSSFGNSAYDNATKTRGIYLQNEVRTGRLTLVPSVRRERNSQFGGFTSYRLATGFEINPQTRLKASYGTAFKAPAFDSLYFPGFGNPNLQPERSKGFEVGAVRQLSGGSLEATYFNNRIQDLIGFASGAFTPTNINRARTSGLELSLDKPFSRGLRLIANQTFTGTDSSSGRLLRRPKFNTSVDILKTTGRWNYDLGVIAQGSRYDADFVNNFTARKYGGFTRLDFTVGYQLKAGPQLYARFGNLLNRKYEEVAGFQAQRFNVALGVKTLAF
ncbi:MAG TPA: TonB-dependent receptor [Abditibacterium sp.]